MELSILSPVQVIFDGDILFCSLPAKEKPFSVLKDHAPIITELNSGILHIQEDQSHSFDLVVNKGFAEVKNNKIVVLLNESPVERNKIDIEKEQKELNNILKLETSTEKELEAKEQAAYYRRVLIWAATK